MELKEYQRKVLERFDDFLSVMRAEKDKSEKAVKALTDAGIDISAGLNDYAKNTWNALKARGTLPRFKSGHGLIVPEWVVRHDALDRPVPHVCFKVPTGGGKTLLGAEGIGRIQTDLFRRQTGLVLWVVPSVQIYRQTWKALSNRMHPYRQILERASGGRVKMLEKDDSFTQQDTENYLCVMLVRLAAARTTNDFFKIFRDAGKYSSFFPEVDDYTANRALMDEYKDLKYTLGVDIALDSVGASTVIKHSLENVLKMKRPIIVIDEGHKAYSDKTRESLSGFNPSFILELTATPNAKHLVSNVLVDVSGVDLKNEQMIKLPINISNAAKTDWQDTLTRAHNKLQELEKKAGKLQETDGRYIRPIMVVRVERTGKDKRDGKKIHALDAKDFLMNRLSIKEEQIRIKTSERDEIGNEDLLDALCPVRYIITKEALQEGWDCPFAYILALLDKTTAQTALTQMIGRILRQPETLSTSIPALNECYVFTFDQKVDEAVEKVRKGLEEEGMTGLGEFVRAADAQTQDDDVDLPVSVTVHRRKKFKGMKIFLPQVLYREGKSWREISYERDILATIDWESIVYDVGLFLDNKDLPEIVTTRIDVKAKDGKDAQGAFDLTATTVKEEAVFERRIDFSFLTRQLLDVIPNPWQASRILLHTVSTLKKRGFDDDQIYAGRLYLIESMKRELKKTVHAMSENLFRQKLKDGDITFRLMTSGTEKLNFEILQEITALAKKSERKLVKRDNTPVENSLFEFVFEKDFNGLEKEFALYLSEDNTIDCWHRMVAKQDYALQGWQRNKVYPDFVVFVNKSKLLVLETKGLQLKGNDDTEYKGRLFDLLSQYHASLMKSGEVDVTDGVKKSVTLSMLMSDEDWKKKYSLIK